MSTTFEHDDAPPRPAAGAVRASDAEREAVVAALHAALGEGRLDLAETETRVSAAYAARDRADLPPLLADLPDAVPPGATSTAAGPGAPSWSTLWIDAVWRARTTVLGADEPRPGARTCRLTALLVALVVLWLVGCLLAGAAVVGP